MAATRPSCCSASANGEETNRTSKPWPPEAVTLPMISSLVAWTDDLGLDAGGRLEALEQIGRHVGVPVRDHELLLCAGRGRRPGCTQQDEAEQPSRVSCHHRSPVTVSWADGRKRDKGPSMGIRLRPSGGAMPDLAGKTVLLTGASKGIGAAAVAALGAAGAHLVAHYGSDRAGAEAATADLPADRVLLVGADLAQTGEVDRLWHEALAWRGRIDVLVNNAAVMRLAGGIEADDDEWDRVWAETLQVNVMAPARLMRHAVGHYRERGGGIIVTVSSWAAQRGPGNPALLAYAASKGAVLAATKTIARNYAKDGVLAYVVAPGVVRTRLSEVASAATGRRGGRDRDPGHGRMGAAERGRGADRVPGDRHLPPPDGRHARHQWRQLHPLEDRSRRTVPRRRRAVFLTFHRMRVRVEKSTARPYGSPSGQAFAVGPSSSRSIFLAMIAPHTFCAREYFVPCLRL